MFLTKFKRKYLVLSKKVITFAIELEKILKMSEIAKNEFKYRTCPYRQAWVNQGIAACKKGKDPFKDCDKCQYLKEETGEMSCISTDENIIIDFEKKKNCTNCHFATEYDKGKFRCWEDPDVIDHAAIFTLSEAKKHICENYKDKNIQICEECKFLGCNGYCDNIHNAEIIDDRIVRKGAWYDKIACEFYKKEV